MATRLRIFAFAFAVGLAAGATPAAASQFGGWIGIVIAGDHRGQRGEQAEVFDNARRDIAGYLVNIGFEPANVRQFSTQPGRYVDSPLRADFMVIEDAITTLGRTARAGCFFYLTSHGGPQGIVLDDRILPPQALGNFFDRFCPDRPTVVILSACYSGTFIPELAADNRMILTAARYDRPSFGCGADFTYTYFDQCVLESFPDSQNFIALAARTRACIAVREVDEGIDPASEPQLYIGNRARPLLQLYSLEPG